MRLLLGALLVIAAVGCMAESPPRGPEATCVKACSSRARYCTERGCRRGCNLVLDRLVEKEGDHVVSCIERNRRCDDRAWAECATLVGPHADGGPPPPPPPKAFEDEGD